MASSMISWLFNRPVSCLARTSRSKQSILCKVLSFRLAYLFLTAVSCSLIPDQNPGDDVLRFHLRLDDKESSSNTCFCLSQHSCPNWLVETIGGETDCKTSSSLIPASVWKFGLSPLTKWDAARFLSLAAEPSLRDPPIGCQKGNDAECDFSLSEQAHAFFPFFPSLVRTLALTWAKAVPVSMLPPTFECLLVLIGVFINVACLLWGSSSLYFLTMTILPTHLPVGSREEIAAASCFVYGIWNPAGVFFATTYSESLFGALTLTGHAAFASSSFRFIAIPISMLASSTRSNGSSHAMWLLLQILGSFASVIVKTRGGRYRSQSLLSSIIQMILYFCGAVAILLPIGYHDQNGYSRHCHEPEIQPDWCQYASSSFSLYGLTQRRHWNVGIFRYYELKQIPNFLLAAPILGLSTLGVIWWIKSSMLAFGKEKLPKTRYMLLIEWPLYALSESVASDNKTAEGSQSTPYDYLIENPKLLGDYAILAGLTMVGLFIAHVQISTRMIFSSSPAIIWFMTYCHLQEENPRLRQFVEAYTALFMFLGMILHVNYLPWT